MLGEGGRRSGSLCSRGLIRLVSAGCGGLVPSGLTLLRSRRLGSGLGGFGARRLSLLAPRLIGSGLSSFGTRGLPLFVRCRLGSLWRPFVRALLGSRLGLVGPSGLSLVVGPLEGLGRGRSRGGCLGGGQRGENEKNGKTWRVHECANCRKIFISVQTALTPRDAGAWAEAFEPPILPETGSTPKLVSEDSPLRRLDDEPAS